MSVDLQKYLQYYNILCLFQLCFLLCYKNLQYFKVYCLVLFNCYVYPFNILFGCFFFEVDDFIEFSPKVKIHMKQSCFLLLNFIKSICCNVFKQIMIILMKLEFKCVLLCHAIMFVFSLYFLYIPLLIPLCCVSFILQIFQ